MMNNFISKKLILMFGVSISMLNSLGLGEIYDTGPAIPMKDSEQYAKPSWSLFEVEYGFNQYNEEFIAGSKYSQTIGSNMATGNINDITNTCKFFYTYYKPYFAGRGLCQDGYIIKNRNGDNVEVLNALTILQITDNDINEMKRIVNDEETGSYIKGPTKEIYYSTPDEEKEPLKLKLIKNPEPEFLLSAEVMGSAPLNYEQKLYLIRESDLASIGEQAMLNSIGNSTYNLNVGTALILGNDELKNYVEGTLGSKMQEINIVQPATQDNVGLEPGEEAHEFGNFKCLNGVLEDVFNENTRIWEYHCKVTIGDDVIANKTIDSYEGGEVSVPKVEIAIKNPNIDINTGLVAYYPLANNSLNESFNSSSNSNDVGGVTYDGVSASFDGINDYIDTGVDFGWDERNGASINIWMKPQNTTQYRPILGKGSSWEWQFMQRYTELKFIYWTLWGNHSNGPVITVPGVFETNTWVNIGLTWDNVTNKLKIYKNGIEVYSADWVNASINADKTNTVKIGGLLWKWASTGTYWNGKMSKLRMYNKSLTPEQNKEIYDREKGDHGGASTMEVCPEGYPIDNGDGTCSEKSKPAIFYR